MRRLGRIVRYNPEAIQKLLLTWDGVAHSGWIQEDDRGAIYGHPYINHRRIADLWSAYLEVPITPDQAAICMALVKVSRLAETPGHRGRDGYVDLVAYASLAAQLATTDPTEFDAY